MTLYQNHKRIEDSAIRNLLRYARGRWTDQSIPTSCGIVLGRVERLREIVTGIDGLDPTKVDTLATKRLGALRRRCQLAIDELEGLVHGDMTAHEVMDIDKVPGPE